MEEIKSSTRRLTKKPPQSHVNGSLDRYDNQSLRSQRSSGSLQRTPSAPTYPRPYAPPGHVRTITSPSPGAYASSSSSLDRQSDSISPNLAATEFGVPSGQGGAKRYSNPTRPLSDQTSRELIGAPFDGSSVLNRMDSTQASGFQNSLRRPPPPPLSHTSPDPRMMSPPLRQSASFSTGDKISEITTPRIPDNQLVSPKRYSDESKDLKSAGLRKKTGFSGFMSGLVGSPRRVNISAPENPVHVTHVGYDNETGQFTVSQIDPRMKIY